MLFYILQGFNPSSYKTLLLQKYNYKVKAKKPSSFQSLYCPCDLKKMCALFSLYLNLFKFKL